MSICKKNCAQVSRVTPSYPTKTSVSIVSCHHWPKSCFGCHNYIYTNTQSVVKVEVNYSNYVPV